MGTALMADPTGPEHVELVGASTLLLGSQAIILQDAADLMQTGPSRGGNMEVGQVDGRLIRARYRDELAVGLSFLIDGGYNLDGTTAAVPVLNGLVLQRMVAAWPDTEGRQFTVRLTTYGDVFEAVASFEEFGRWERPAPRMWRSSMLLTVAAGRLEPVA